MKVTINIRIEEELANELRAMENYSAFVNAAIEKNLKGPKLIKNFLHINGERHVVYCEANLKDVGIRFTGQ